MRLESRFLTRNWLYPDGMHRDDAIQLVFNRLGRTARGTFLNYESVFDMFVEALSLLRVIKDIA